VKLDPRAKVSQSDVEQQFKMLLALRDQLNRVYEVVNQIQDVREQMGMLRKSLAPVDSSKPLLDAAGTLDTKLVAMRDPLINLKISANEDSLAYPPGIDGRLAFLAMSVAGSADSAPTESQLQIFDELKEQTDAALAQWEQLQKSDVAAFQKLAADQGIRAIQVPDARSTRAQGRGGEEP